MDWIIPVLFGVSFIIFIYNLIGFIFMAKKRAQRFKYGVLFAVVLVAVGAYSYTVIVRIEATYPASKTFFQPTDTVMVIVPHPDDDLLLAAPVMAFAARSGAKVLLVMATNGDARNLGPVRLNETLNTLTSLGIPKENAIFMGYSNGVMKELYQTDKPYEIQVSGANSGQTQTVGLPGYPDYHTAQYGTPATFTRENFLRDLLEIIQLNQPTHLYIIDWDSHHEHIALSLFTDETLAALLKTPDNTYFPKIYKGFAYNTGFRNPRDIDASVTLLPTFQPPQHQLGNLAEALDNPHYLWADRLRMPVPRDMLYPDIVRNRAAQSFRCYMSQKPMSYISSFINSDKPYWERPTGSVAYNAVIEASSGNPAVLNDFKLLDYFNPAGSLWTPAEDDGVSSFTVDLGDTHNIAEVRLYFNPDNTKRISMAHLSFDNDKVLLDSFELGKPMARIDAYNRACRQITFQITAGAPGCGVAEIEIFTQKPAPEAFIKITDASAEPSNFAYALIVDKSVTPRLPLEVYAPHVLDHNAVSWRIMPADAGVSINGGYLHISDTAKGRYTVTARAGELEDTVGVLVTSGGDLNIYRCWQQILHCTKVYYQLRYYVYRQKVKP